MKTMNLKTGRILVNAFERNQKPVMAFCKEQGVAYHILKYWRDRIAELDQHKSSQAFVQIRAAAPTTVAKPETADVDRHDAMAAAMAILPNGVRIAFQQSNDVTVGVIEALARC